MRIQFGPFRSMSNFLTPTQSLFAGAFIVLAFSLPHSVVNAQSATPTQSRRKQPPSPEVQSLLNRYPAPPAASTKAPPVRARRPAAPVAAGEARPPNPLAPAVAPVQPPSTQAPQAFAFQGSQQPLTPEAMARQNMAATCNAKIDPKEKQECLKSLEEADRAIYLRALNQERQQESQRKEQRCETLLDSIKKTAAEISAGCQAFNPQNPGMSHCRDQKASCERQIAKLGSADDEEEISCEDFEAETRACLSHPFFATGKDPRKDAQEAEKEYNELATDFAESQQGSVESKADKDREIARLQAEIRAERNEYARAREQTLAKAEQAAKALKNDMEERFRQAAESLRKMDQALDAAAMDMAAKSVAIETFGKNFQAACRAEATKLADKFQKEQQARLSRRRNTGGGLRNAASQSTSIEELVKRHAAVEKANQLAACMEGTTDEGLKMSGALTQMRSEFQVATMQLQRAQADRMKAQQTIQADIATIERQATEGTNDLKKNLATQLDRLLQDSNVKVAELSQQLTLLQQSGMQKMGADAQRTGQMAERLQRAKSRFDVAKKQVTCSGKLGAKSETRQTSMLERIEKGFEAMDRIGGECDSLKPLIAANSSTCSAPPVCSAFTSAPPADSRAPAAAAPAQGATAAVAP